MLRNRRGRHCIFLLPAVIAGMLLLIYAALYFLVPGNDHHAEKNHGYAGTNVIAHRGGSGLWPENTLFAFQNAAILGVDALEMDVRTTADGVLGPFAR